MIIALTGVAGSGKTYRRDQYVKEGYYPLDFKDALIDMAEDLVGFPIRENYEIFKENVIGVSAPDLWNPMRMSLARISDDIVRRAPSAMTGRTLMQRLGTEVMRKRDPEYWTKAWIKKAEELIGLERDIVCADCRFPNELEAINQLWVNHRHPYKIIFCDFHSSRYNPMFTHESEKMAQQFLKRGYTDGCVIKYLHE